MLFYCKRFIITISCAALMPFVFLLSAALPLYAQTQSPAAVSLSLTEKETAFLERHPRISIGIMDNWPPITYVNAGGQRLGIDVAYVKLLNQRLNGLMTVSYGPFKEILEKVKDKRLDALMDVTPNTEREKFLNFTKSYLNIPHVIVAPKEKPFYVSEKDLSGKTLALEKGFGNVKYFSENYPEVKIREYPDTRFAIDAVARGEADAYAGNRAVAIYIIENELITNLKTHGRLKKRGSILTIGVRKDWPEMASILDKALASITDKEKHSIVERWVEPTVTAEDEKPLDLTNEEKNFLSGKKLRLGIDEARPPFEFLDKHKTYRGLSADFIHEVAHKLGIEVVPLKDLSWTEAMEKVKTGEVDIIAKVSLSAERAKFMTFTKPYISFHSVIVMQKNRSATDLDSLLGMKVGVNNGQIVEANLKRDYPQLLLVPYPNVKDGLKALVGGKIDAYVDNLAAVSYVISTEGYTNLKIASTTEYRNDMAFGVRKDWPLLASALDKALDSMSDKEINDIKNRWLAVRYEGHINWKMMGWIGGGLLLVIVFVLVWNRRLGKAVRELEKSERKVKAMSEAVLDAMIMIDSQGKVIFWNPAAEKLFGYTAAEAAGRDFHGMTALPEDKRKAREGLKQFAKTGHGAVFGYTIETKAVDRTGRIFPVEVSLSPLQMDEEWFAVGTVRDISERRKGEEALREAEERSRLILTSVSEGIFGIDLEGKTTFVNPAAASMLGYKAEELFGQPMHEKVHHTYPDGRPFPHEACPMYLSTQDGISRTIDDEVLWRKDGNALQVEYTTTPVQKDGQIMGTVVSFRDITERKRMEQRIIEEGERLRQILDTAPVSIAFSTKGKIHFANPLFAETFGAKAGDVSPQLYVRPEEGNMLVERLKNEGIIKNYELQMFDSRKQVREMLITYLPISYDNEEGILAWLTDITERKQSEKGLKQHMDELERFMKLTIDRELKMIELKEEINTCLTEMGREAKYKIVE